MRSFNSFLAVSLVLFSLFVAGTAQAQRSGSTGNGSSTTTTAPNPNPSTGVNSTTRLPGEPTVDTVFLSGKVLMAGGTPPPEPVPVFRVCNGTPHREVMTSSKGDFSIILGSRVVSGLLPDASESGRGNSITATTARGIEQQLNGCELRAELPGYTSTVILLASFKTLDSPNVGTIFLHKVGGDAVGTSISVTSMLVPKKARSEFEKARELASKQKLSDADAHLSKALEIYPKYAEAWLMKGEVEQNQKNLVEAEKAYRAALEADPNYIPPYLRLAGLAADNKKWEEMISLTDKVISLDPMDYPIAYYFNSAANLNANRLPQAEKSALKAAEIDKGHQVPRIEVLLAAIYSAKGDVATAASHYREYLRILPQAPDSAQIKTALARLEATAAAGSPAEGTPQQ